MPNFYVKKSGKLISSVYFELAQLPASCSCKVLSRISLVTYPYKLSKEEEKIVYKFIANSAFNEATEVNQLGNEYPCFTGLRTRILLTASERTKSYLSWDMIKTMGLQIGPEYPGGHGNYKMIMGALDSDKHIYTDIPEEYTIGATK